MTYLIIYSLVLGLATYLLLYKKIGVTIFGASSTVGLLLIILLPILIENHENNYL